MDLDRSIGFYHDILELRFLFRAPPGLAWPSALCRCQLPSRTGTEPRHHCGRGAAAASYSGVLHETILDAWRTNARLTTFLIEGLPEGLWSGAIPGAPRRSIGGMATHLHNCRCSWIRTLGSPHGIAIPPRVERGARRAALVRALGRSEQGIHALLQLGLEHGGAIPPSAGYVWRNLPLDVGHVLTYFVAHEAHHRGQLVLTARALGHRLPPAIINGLWQWTARSREARQR